MLIFMHFSGVKMEIFTHFLGAKMAIFTRSSGGIMNAATGGNRPFWMVRSCLSNLEEEEMDTSEGGVLEDS